MHYMIIVPAMILSICVGVFLGGCSMDTTLDTAMDTLNSVANTLEDVAGEKPGADTEMMCYNSLGYSVEALNRRNGLELCHNVASMYILGDLHDTYDLLKNDPYNEELNRIIINGVTGRIFDEDLGINYDTVSDMDFIIKDMSTTGSFTRAKCEMINGGQSQNVIVRWQIDNSGGMPFWMLYSVMPED